MFPRASIGLEINDHAIKYVEVNARKRALVLTSYGTEVLGPSIVTNGLPTNPGALTEALTKLFAMHPDARGDIAKRHSIAMALPETNLFVRTVTLPAMDEEEVANAVAYQVEQYIPLTQDQVYLDSQIIDRHASGEMHVLLAAAPRQMIDDYTTILKKAHLAPSYFELEPAAIMRALVKPETVSATKGVILTDVGAKKTSLAAVREGSLDFTAGIDIGGESIVTKVAQAKKLDTKRAEGLVRRVGLRKKKDPEVFELIKTEVDMIVAEIKKAVEYVGRQNSQAEHTITEVLLSGGVANLTDLPAYIELATDIPTSIGDPFLKATPLLSGRFTPLSKIDALSYVTSIGLALRPFQET
ncbi:MAG: type IV pilus assembly protein PilM [Parcubacteria group bacterium]|nr:type IV pilus assembly protein PilM [Parcubacteria group bacterium]